MVNVADLVGNINRGAAENRGATLNRALRARPDFPDDAQANLNFPKRTTRQRLTAIFPANRSRSNHGTRNTPDNSIGNSRKTFG
jgi:hypothetical protein